MKYFFCFIISVSSLYGYTKPAKGQPETFYSADNPNIKYVGRVLFTNPLKPKFWSPGVYVQAKFEGTSLEIFVDDEELYGVTHNYLEIAIDDRPPFRIPTTGRVSDLKVAEKLPPGKHTVTICKDTESGIGYIEFVGLKCEKLLPMKLPKHKIEYIGDSITCGSGTDLSVSPCGKGNWYDQHNAYMSYGPVTSRALNAQWVLTAVSGIGLIHSCCNIETSMPMLFDKVFLRNDSIQWDFSRYIPDVVTICLGQNDGNQDSVVFCSAYVAFIKQIRGVYPKADIVCLSSPMANAELTVMLKKYILSIQQCVNEQDDNKVYHYFFSRSYNGGCGGHPDMAQHQLIADELTTYLKQLEDWY